MSNNKFIANEQTLVSEADVSVRLCNILGENGILTIADIRSADWYKLRKAHQMGKRTWEEFIAFTSEYNIRPVQRKDHEARIPIVLDGRDELAMAAMQYYLSTAQEEGYEEDGAWTSDTKSAAARHSYLMADAMLKAREQ